MDGGGFGGGGGGFGGGGGGFGGGGGGFGGHGGGFGGHGGGFGGHGGGFGGHGGGFGGHHGGPGGFGFGGGHHGPGGGFGGPGGFGFGGGLLGPGPIGFGGGPRGPGGFMGGPVFAPWLGALAVTAVAASVVSPYSSYGSGRQPGMVVWTEDGTEKSAQVNMLTVRVCQAQKLKKVQLLGKQDPYVRAKLYFDGHKIGECRSSTSVDGGKNPVWQNMSRSMFTFYVPATVTLDRLTLTLDIINDNLISDGFIGTTGSIAMDRAANGEARWWNISTGGTVQAIIELVSNDTAPTPPNTVYRNSSVAPASNINTNQGGNGGGRVATINPSPHVAVAHATPAVAPAPYGSGNGNGGGAYGAGTNAPFADTSPPAYEVHATPAATQYRPPPTAPGSSGRFSTSDNRQVPTSSGYDKSEKYYGGGGAALPEARAVPVYQGNSADDPYNARGAAAAASASAYGASAPAGAGAYAAPSAYPVLAAPPSSQQRYQQQQLQPQRQQPQQNNSTNRGAYNSRYGNM